MHGTGTANEFDALVDRFGKEAGFKITKKPGGFGPSDHSSFYGAKIPVLHFFTGSHKDYHRPSDDYDKMNVGGMRRVGELVADMATTLAEADEPPHYQEVKGRSELGGDGDRPYFGSIPDFAQEEPGYALSGVTKGGPAERAGIKAGDIIVQLRRQQDRQPRRLRQRPAQVQGRRQGAGGGEARRERGRSASDARSAEVGRRRKAEGRDSECHCLLAKQCFAAWHWHLASAGFRCQRGEWKPDPRPYTRYSHPSWGVV